MTAPEDEAAAARRRDRRLAMARAFADNVPHNHALGIVIEAMGDATARFRLPYAAKLVGNPETGVLHGGAITALLDACAGAAVFAALPVRIRAIAKAATNWIRYFTFSLLTIANCAPAGVPHYRRSPQCRHRCWCV